MAVVTQHSSTTASAAQQARHIALPVLALGVVIAILYLGRRLLYHFADRRDHRLHTGTVRGPVDADSLPAFAGQLRGVFFALALLYVIGLGAYSQLAGLYDELPKYGQRIGELVDKVQQRISAMEAADL